MCSESNTTPLSLFHKPFINHMFQKRIIKFLKLTKLWRKKTTKTWLANVAAIFTHRTSLLHRIIPPDSFYLKTKIGYIFSFHSSLGILIFTFDMCVWMTYIFCILKNKGNNVRCTTEGEKSNKCCTRNHTILFVCLRGTAQEYLFRSYQLFILRENSLDEGEI